MKKIYELEYQVNKILDGFYSDYVNNGSPITLREILTFGFNGVYKNGEYLGYDEEDFTQEQLDSQVKVVDIDKDSDEYTIVIIDF